MQTGRQAYRKPIRQTNIQTDTQANRQTGKHTLSETDTDRQ